MADLLSQKEFIEGRTHAIYYGGPLIFFVSIAFFMLSAATYGGFLLLNAAQERAREELKEQIRLKEETIQPALVEQIFLLEARLKTAATLLREHTIASNIFPFLESITYPTVRFTGLEFSVAAGRVNINMNGNALGFAELARQINLIERDERVESVEFTGLSLNEKENTVAFKLSLIPKLSVLRPKP